MHGVNARRRYVGTSRSQLTDNVARLETNKNRINANPQDPDQGVINESHAERYLAERENREQQDCCIIM